LSFAFRPVFFLSSSAAHPALPSFPTRRSSDLMSYSLFRPCPHPAGRGGRTLSRFRFRAGSGPGRRSAAHARSPLGVRSTGFRVRSEEHTSELQSRENLVCRLLLEKKKTRKTIS